MSDQQGWKQCWVAQFIVTSRAFFWAFSPRVILLLHEHKMNSDNRTVVWKLAQHWMTVPFLLRNNQVDGFGVKHVTLLWTRK